MGKTSSLVEEVVHDPPTPMSFLLLSIVLWKTTHFALLDSGASDSFISLDVVQESRLNLLPMKYTIKVMVANGHTLNVVTSCEFARQLETYTCQYFCASLAPHYQLYLALGYPFLHQFNPLINWERRTVEIIHEGTTHVIPVVKDHGNPHTPMSVDSADGDRHAVQK